MAAYPANTESCGCASRTLAGRDGKGGCSDLPPVAGNVDGGRWGNDLIDAVEHVGGQGDPGRAVFACGRSRAGDLLTLAVLARQPAAGEGL
jgi:hypothetical protein